MDIVVLSLSEGDPAFYAPLDSDRSPAAASAIIFAQAVESAVDSGVVVVASAGNDGNVSGIGRVPTLGTIHRPGTTPSAITVGATLNSHNFYQSVKVSGAGVPASLQNIRALASDGPQLVGSPLNAPIRDAGGDGLACSALAAGSLAGAIALIQRGGTCTFSDKVNNAQAAGAVGVVVYQLNECRYRGSSHGTPPIPAFPAMLIGYTDGTALKSYLASNSGCPGLARPGIQRGGGPGRFRSGRPHRGGRPSASFPVTSTRQDGRQAGVSGAGRGHLHGHPEARSERPALPRQRLYRGDRDQLCRPDRGRRGRHHEAEESLSSQPAADLKSLVVNTAERQGLTDESGAARMNSVGAGKLNLADAVNAAATLTPDTIQFGLQTATTVSVSRTLTIRNLGSCERHFQYRGEPARCGCEFVT